MRFHHSAINFRNLIQDLADMYTFSVPEVVVTELVANCLDARATRIELAFDPKSRLLVVEDNGLGMTREQFNEYHDFAAGLKGRGASIGFAGLGAKISFNAASRVVTETTGEDFSGASNWYLKSQRELVWEELEGTGSLDHPGTRVEVRFNPDADIPFSSPEDLQAVLMRHYLPLFDRGFLDLYSALEHYSPELRFAVNGREIARFDLEERFGLESAQRFFLETKGKRYGYGLFGVSPTEFPVGEDAPGVGFCVYGKLVQSEFLNQWPGEIAPRLFGMVEVPPFIEFLNTSKTGFMRQRGNAVKFRRFYEPVRQEFKHWLADIGVRSVEAIATEDAVRLEQEVKKLVRELPELSSFFGLSTPREMKAADPEGGLSGGPQEKRQEEVTSPDEGEPAEREEPAEGKERSETLAGDGEKHASPVSRPRKAGIHISFVDAPARQDLAWLEGDTVIINSGHPSYLKAKNGSPTRKLHNLFSIAICLDRELKEQGLLQAGEDFVNRMMYTWGKMR